MLPFILNPPMMWLYALFAFVGKLRTHTDRCCCYFMSLYTTLNQFAVVTYNATVLPHGAVFCNSLLHVAVSLSM